MSAYRGGLKVGNQHDYEAVKRNAFHDQDVLVVSVNDPRISWEDRLHLKNIGERLYGKIKPAGRV